MNALWGHAIGVITLLLMAIFIGIWIWAWLPRHRRTFERLARIPMRDEAASHE
jgi:cytochrome c oxidase cbb3-type subunit IV